MEDRDGDALAAAIVELEREPERYRRMAAAARELAVAELTPLHLDEVLENAYARVLGLPATTSVPVV